MGSVLGKFIEPLKKVFPLPKSAEGHEDQFFDAYFQVLKTFDDITLSDAASHIIATRTQRSFPLPAECNLACAEAIAGEAIRARQEARPGNRHEQRDLGDRHPEWSDRRRKNADQMIQCDMGRRAVQEDWIWTLWEFCRENERLPDLHEEQRVRAKGMSRSAQINAAVDKDQSFGDVAGLKKMRAQIVARLRSLVLVEA
jgi:hypothetical protein